MTVQFKFDGTKPLDENFAAFLDFLKNVDEDMTAILRANAPALAAIVRDGERDGDARADFNSAIAAALDVLAARDPEAEGA